MRLRQHGRCPLGRAAARFAALMACAGSIVLVACPGTDTDSDNPASGRFRKVRARALSPFTADEREEIAKLQSLGYLAGSKVAKTNGGVLLYNEKEAYKGYNLYSSGHGAEAILMDMKGHTIHRWQKGFHEIWPGRRVRNLRDWYRRVRLLPDGSLLVIFEGRGMAKLDDRSEVIWANEEGFHHDVDLGPDGTLYSLTRKAHIVSKIHRHRPVAEHFVTVVDPSGRVTKKVSLVTAFENASPQYRRFWNQREIPYGDIFHSNSIRLLKGRIADRIPAFAAGNVLISIRNMDTIAVVDIEQEKVVWAVRGMFRRQHDAEILENGRLLLFDNRRMKKYSAVREFDPQTMLQKWVYRGGRDRPFFSHSCGNAQRLPGGNTLITESDNGRAFEVTASLETVWEFQNPNRAGKNRELIATLFEMVRLPPDFPVNWAGER